MIEFRQKIFRKQFNKKEFNSWVKKQMEGTNPLTLGLSTAATGLGVANYSVNKKRKEADVVLREEQIKATKDLEKALKKVKGVSERDAKTLSQNMKKSYTRRDPDDEHPYVTQAAIDKIIKKK